MKVNGRSKNGGPRPCTGPKVRRIMLDNDTTDMIRALTNERRMVSPGINEHKIVNELIRAAWSESHPVYQTAAERE